MQPVETAKSTSPAPRGRAGQTVSLDMTQNDQTLELAKDLAKFIKDNKLTTNIQGREFVNVEGWQYAGSRLGIVPIVEHVVSVGSAEEIKYQAKVSLFNIHHELTVGQGFAVCSNKESGKKFYQEFAILSMAQTRAIGKAYRNCLAWVIRAAGYEPTPAEEMDYLVTSAAAPAPAGAAPAPAPTDRRTGGATLVGPLEAPAAEEPLPEMRITPAADKPATREQKEEIIRLLNHVVITRPEKTKMHLHINRLTEERALESITKLNKTIWDRTPEHERPRLAPAPNVEAAPAVAPAPKTAKPPRTNSLRDNSVAKLRAFVQKNQTRLGVPEADRLLTICDSPRFSPANIDAELLSAQQWLQEAQAA